MTHTQDQRLDLETPVPRRRQGGVGLSALAAALALALGTGSTHAADWPTHMHDNTRSGVTAERIEPPLSECWVFAPRHGPQPAWPETAKEYLKVCYDQAFHVAVADAALYFGSSADNTVYCLDASTGQVRWMFPTGGPVRVAPTVWQGRVYVGSDDGYAYCLDAAGGEMVWRLRGGPNDRKVLGNGRMISVWPIRTGVMVGDGIAYFCAGLFPTESVFLYAVRAADGQVVWQNDTSGQTYTTMPHGGDDGFNGISPQGALLASSRRLYVPTGRNVPAAFDREDGRLVRVHRKTSKLRGGGTWALLLDDLILSGPDGLLAYSVKTGAKFAKFSGRRLVVAAEMAYLLTDTGLSALDRKAHATLSNKRTMLGDEQRGLSYRKIRLEREHVALSAKLKAVVEKQETAQAALQGGKQRAVSKEEDELNEKLATMDTELRALDEKLKALGDELSATGERLNACVKWQYPCKCPYALVLAGGVLFAGGQDQVVAVDASDGQAVWMGEVAGKAWGLAASGGRLFVSTDTGAVTCFGSSTPRRPEPTAAVREPHSSSPYPPDDLTPAYAAAAKAIVDATRITKVMPAPA